MRLGNTVRECHWLGGRSSGCSEFDAEFLRHRLKLAIWPPPSKRRCRPLSRRGATSDRHPIGAGDPFDRPHRVLGQRRDCDRSAWVGGERQANQRRKRVRARLLHDGTRWFSTVRWLINAGPAAREPHRPVADVVLPYAVKSYREALHCCDTGFFRRFSRPNQDGALLKSACRRLLACC
jgi:hypothetical protein